MKTSFLKITTALCALLLVPLGTAQAQTATSAPITGEIERQGELLILRADPATYRGL